MNKRILLTGPPGIGKTTLIKEVIKHLSDRNISINGFYTEEVRENSTRIGFDLRTLDGKKDVLARKGGSSACRVGTYSVYLENFERTVLPVLDKPSDVLILDEIGKMELFSKKFEIAVKNIFKKENITIIATLPYRGGGRFVQELFELHKSDIIVVDMNNRDTLLNDILEIMK